MGWGEDEEGLIGTQLPTALIPLPSQRGKKENFFLFLFSLHFFNPKDLFDFPENSEQRNNFLLFFFFQSFHISKCPRHHQSASQLSSM